MVDANSNGNTAQNLQVGQQQYQGEQHVCPNCGRCPCCGRGGYQFQPWPGYPNPYIGDPLPNPWGGTYWGPNTIGGISGTDNIGGLTSSAGPHNHQVWM